MMSESKNRVTRAPLVVALLVGLAALGSAPNAHASSKFPEALQKALNNEFKAKGVTFGVPTCAACHLTTVGGPSMLNVFGYNLEHDPTFPNLILGNGGDVDAKVQAAVTKYFGTDVPTPPDDAHKAMADFPNGPKLSYDADGDGKSDYDELADNDSPSIPGAEGVGQFIPSDAAVYGCFARVASAPPADRSGLFSAGLAVLGLAAFRRLKRVRRSR
jgi:hypothetical protein